jgi:hypothetical protein
MASGDPIRVFVTHAWSETDDYLRAFEYLQSARNFRYQNCSAPGRRPGQGGVVAERDELRRQISTAEAVIALGGLLGPERALVTFEMTYAKSIDKPVVLLPPFGGGSVAASFKGLFDEELTWDERALSDALRRQARHEQTTRFDTIEFKIDDLK